MSKDWKAGQRVDGATKTRPSGETYSAQLSDLAASDLLPTPMSTDIHHAGRVKELKEQGKTKFRSREKGQSGANGLMDYMDFHWMLPTPKAQEAKGNIHVDRGKRNLTDEICKMTASLTYDGATSQLNPLFVGEMMGFPLDWLVSPFLSGGPKP